ncbi:hypothetical protein C5E45_06305 [Nocardia nova]|uniref:Uncharacterized protein n=1 Tax=Nocardia nova TaxID=37330 RepID=A0A2S6AV72_9NOCA|nr:hypothetical protein [Nocardia nova]PPJ32405.1 hypothetical protein C5E41_04420 [Nocardia nova]PPJ39084.1 hypothetical protein C5E45_06305 [Nocardia nova]
MYRPIGRRAMVRGFGAGRPAAVAGRVVTATVDPAPRTPLRTVDYQLAHPQPAIGTRWTPDPEDFPAGPPRPPAPWESGRKDVVRVDGATT